MTDPAIGETVERLALQVRAEPSATAVRLRRPLAGAATHRTGPVAGHDV